MLFLFPNEIIIECTEPNVDAETETEPKKLVIEKGEPHRQALEPTHGNGRIRCD